ncbi:MAG TPA: outer membrane protein transport protein, partial [Gemmatimonadaceae bacterium]|nr:outer membrane protein transport protein [Gemmatimonadaceae bacterium]
NATARFIQLGTNLVVADATLAGQLGVPVGTPWDAILATNFRGGGALVQQKVRTLITHPGQIQFGVGYTAPTGTLVSVDGAHIRWSKFDVLPVTFLGAARTRSRTLIEDYDDSWAVRGSAEHKLANVALRGGISWVKTPAPDVTVTPLLPDQDRVNYAFGVGLPFTFGKTPLAFDASYLLVDTQGRRGRVIERTSVSQTAEQLNSGFYRLKANIFSISLKAQL